MLLTSGYVANHSKLALCTSNVRAIYGFVPTIKGRFSSARILSDRRLGISDSAYDAEEIRDCVERGRPKERSLDKVRGRGSCVMNLLRSAATSGDAGFGDLKRLEDTEEAHLRGTKGSLCELRHCLDP